MELAGFREVARELLQDAQERLIYKADVGSDRKLAAALPGRSQPAKLNHASTAQSYVETEIKGFAPSQADLNYPERLEAKVIDLYTGCSGCLDADASLALVDYAGSSPL